MKKVWDVVDKIVEIVMVGGMILIMIWLVLQLGAIFMRQVCG